jgi:hypothetical protein
MKLKKCYYTEGRRVYWEGTRGHSYISSMVCVVTRKHRRHPYYSHRGGRFERAAMPRSKNRAALRLNATSTTRIFPR